MITPAASFSPLSRAPASGFPVPSSPASGLLSPSLPPAGSPTPDAPSQTEGLREAAQAFEAIFVRQMLTAARASDFGGEDLFGGPGLEQFEAMQDENFAKITSQTSSFGLAASIERQLAAQMPNARNTP